MNSLMLLELLYIGYTVAFWVQTATNARAPDCEFAIRRSNTTNDACCRLSAKDKKTKFEKNLVFLYIDYFLD